MPANLNRKQQREIKAVVERAKKDNGIPQTAQQSIPFQRMFPDGICRVTDSYYTKTIQFQDINYQLAQQEDKTAIFDEWCSFLNFFDSSIHFELSFMNLSTDAESFEKSIRIPFKKDSFNPVRAEYSQMLKKQLAQGNNGLTKTKYLTFGIEAESMRQAKPRLNHIENDLLNNFRRLGVIATTMNGKERLHLMHSMFHMGDNDKFFFDWKYLVESGLSVKDFIAPTAFAFKTNRTFQMGSIFGSMSYLAITASDLSDRMLADFLDMESTQIVTMHIQSVDQNKAIKQIKAKISDIDKMKEFVDDFRKIAPDKYYTFGSNYYLGYQGIKEGMDYFTTCRIGGEGWGKYNTHTRGSFSFADAYDGGMINHFHPNSTMNFDEACDKAGIPIISHETGQFQTYPDYREMKKYTGVLHPYNFEVFRRRLAAAGMLSQADDFHKASGLWSVKLYKADIEMDLRTRNMAGFQLLDIQDYPGQGSAFVGILDAFMESKGITTPEEWRQWCSPVVPLLVTDKFCYEENDTMKAKIQIANYGGESLKGKKVEWKLDYAKDERYPNESSVAETLTHLNQPSPLAQGEITIHTDEEGWIDVGEIVHKMKVKANGIDDGDGKCLDVYVGSRKLTLSLYIYEGELDATRYSNTYDLWVYTTPKNIDYLKKQVVIAKDLTSDVVKKLEKGAKVLWLPTTSSHFVAADDTLSQSDNATPYTVGGLFQTDYWNYRMFKAICENNKKKVSPGTLGILTNPEHPIFKGFPTEMHTNWQWFPIIKESHPLVLDNFAKDYRPVVQVIDNIERNHKLGLVMEWKVGAGKLLICMSDLEKAAKYPEGKAFYQSVIDYMRSASFNPSAEITVDELKKKLVEKPRQVSLKELNNISQY